MNAEYFLENAMHTIEWKGADSAQEQCSNLELVTIWVEALALMTRVRWITWYGSSAVEDLAQKPAHLVANFTAAKTEAI